jgi:hypothetical protein
LNIFPALPVPDSVFATKQEKQRIEAVTEYGYVVKRHRSNFAPRTFNVTYKNIKLSDRALLRNFFVQQDYGITAFLFKQPVEDLSINASSLQDALHELEDDTTGDLGQGFQLEVQSKIHRIQVWLKKTGSPSGNLTLKITTDDTNKPSGSILATSDTVAVSTVTTGYTLIEFTFSTPARLEPFTQYHWTLEGDATYDSSYATGVTVVELGIDSSSPTYAYGNLSRYAPSAWTADATKAAIFTIPDYTKVQTDGSLWQEERLSGASGGIFNIALTLVEDA